MAGEGAEARRLWLPWRPRLRLIFAYPRYWHWVCVQLERFDRWFTHRYRAHGYWKLLLPVVFVGFLAVRFLALVAVFEITIIAFAASIYLVWGEWTALVLLFPVALLARLAHLRPWPLAARSGARRWSAHATGWRVAGQTATTALDALRAGREPAGTTWTDATRRSPFWI